MDNKTIIIKHFSKSKGSYDYVEFCQTTKQYTIGDSAAHLGHGDYLTMIKVVNKKELHKVLDNLISNNYQHIETFR